MTLRMMSGDLLDSHRQTLTNTVNCVGSMGKGIALKFRKRYPEMYVDYVERCAHGLVVVGAPYVFPLSDGRLVCNFPTKQHWRSPSRLAWVEQGLATLQEQALDWGVTSIAVPPLGCGNGGLDWAAVEPLMRAYLEPLVIPIDVYVPPGVQPDPPEIEQLSLLN